MLKQNESIIIKWSSGLLIAVMVFGFFAPFQLVFAKEQESNLSGFTITGLTADESEITTEVVTVEDTESNPIDILTLSLVVSSSTTDSFSSIAVNEDPSSNIQNMGILTVGSRLTTTLGVIAIVGTTTEITVDIDVALTIYATTTPRATEMLKVYNMPWLNSINIDNATSYTVDDRPTITVTSTPITAIVSYIGSVSYIESSENLEGLRPDDINNPSEVIIDEDEPNEIIPMPAIFAPQGIIGNGGGASNSTVPVPQNSTNAFNQEDETGNESEDTDKNIEKVRGDNSAITVTNATIPSSNATINTSGSAENIPSTKVEIRENIFEIYTQIFDLFQQLTEIIQSQVIEKSTNETIGE